MCRTVRDDLVHGPFWLRILLPSRQRQRLWHASLDLDACRVSAYQELAGL